MNKKELQEKIIILENTSNSIDEKDAEKREEFAKSFDWYNEKTMYDSKRILRTPSWEEIFVEVGRLLATQKFLFYITNGEELKIKTKELELGLNELNKRRNKNE